MAAVVNPTLAKSSTLQCTHVTMKTRRLSTSIATDDRQHLAPSVMATTVNPILASYIQPAVETHQQLPTSTAGDIRQYLAPSVIGAVVNPTLAPTTALQPVAETKLRLPTSTVADIWEYLAPSVTVTIVNPTLAHAITTYQQLTNLFTSYC